MDARHNYGTKDGITDLFIVPIHNSVPYYNHLSMIHVYATTVDTLIIIVVCL